jgi:hypothetical protein
VTARLQFPPVEKLAMVAKESNLGGTSIQKKKEFFF